MDFNDPLFRMIRQTQDMVDRAFPPSTRELLDSVSRIVDHPAIKAVNALRIPEQNSNISRMIKSIENNYIDVSTLYKDIFTPFDGSSFIDISTYDWKKSFPTLFDNSNLSDIIQTPENFQRIQIFTDSIQRLVKQDSLDENTFPDAVTLALNLNESEGNEEVLEMIDEMNSMLTSVQEVVHSDFEQFYNLIDSFIISIKKIKNNKTVQQIFLGVITAIITNYITAKFIEDDKDKPTINYSNQSNDNSTHIIQNITNIIVVSSKEIEAGKLYVSDTVKYLKNVRDSRSKTILEIPPYSKIKVIEPFKNWVCIRVMDGKDFPLGYITISDLYAIKD